MQNSKQQDILLWDAIRTGKPDAFQVLYDQYIDVLFAFGMGYSNDKEFVKDCIHDLITDLYKYRKQISKPENLKNYLLVSLRRKIHKNKSGKISISYYPEMITNPENSQDSAEREMINQEISSQTNKLLFEAIKGLPGKQKEALHLKYSCELSYTEISKLMGISIESVRTQVYRAIKSLKDELSSTGIILLSLLNKRFNTRPVKSVRL